MPSNDDFDSKAYLKAFGEQVAKVRRAKGYSQDRVALEAGFSRGTMSKIEAGLVDPKTTTLIRIAETLGVPVTKFFEQKKNKNNFS